MADPTPNRRKRLRVPAALFLAVLAVDTVVWAVACRRLDDGARDAAQQAAWTVVHAPLQWSGWPIAAQVTWPDTTVRANTGDTTSIAPPLTWTVPSLTLRLSAFSPTHLTVTAIGAQTLAVGAAPPVPFTASELVATIDLTQHDPPHLAAAVLIIDAPAFPVRVATASVLGRSDGGSADLAGITFPARDGHPVHPAIDTLRLDAHITPSIQQMATATDSAIDWRAHDGHLDLDLRTLHWGALTATAQATITLDPALQPQADGTMTATGLSATPSQLADNGVISPASASAATGVLAILAAPAGGGPVTLPLAWQGGILSIARFPLLRTAPLRWE